MDEPENKKWGGVMTKPLLDSMAAYAKQYFPTLPMGPSHGPNGYYQWRPNERYRVVDYVLNQYAYWVTNGDVAEWRDKVLAQAKRDGVGVAFSMNILNGGETASRDGRWACPAGTSAGRGTQRARVPDDGHADPGLGEGAGAGRLRHADVAVRRRGHGAAGQPGGDARRRGRAGEGAEPAVHEELSAPEVVS